MLKKVLFAALATAFVTAVALPIQFASAATPLGTVTCKAAAKAKFATDMKGRHAYKKACKAAWKASQKA